MMENVITGGEALKRPGGILHWRHYFAFLASPPGTQFLADAGVAPPSDALRNAADELAMAIDALMSDPRASDGDFFVEQSANVLHAAFSRLAEDCGLNGSAVVIEYGMVDPGTTAHGFLWGVFFERLLRGEAKAGNSVSAAVHDVLRRWKDSLSMGTDDDELVRYRSLQQAWEEIRAAASAGEIEALVAWGRSEAAALGIEGILEPLGIGYHPAPLDPGED